MRVVAAATALLMLPITPAMAQTPSELLSCAAIARDAERLACYDNAMANSSPAARAANEVRAKESARLAAEAAAAAVVAAKAQAEADKQARRQAFGIEGVVKRPDRFKPGPDEVTSVDAGIVEMLTNKSGLGVFVLDNGQIWKQADTVSLPNIRTGDKVTIAKNNFGGYDLTLLKQKRVSPVVRLK